MNGIVRFAYKWLIYKLSKLEIERSRRKLVQLNKQKNRSKDQENESEINRFE